MISWWTKRCRFIELLPKTDLIKSLMRIKQGWCDYMVDDNTVTDMQYYYDTRYLTDDWHLSSPLETSEGHLNWRMGLPELLGGNLGCRVD